MAKKEENKKKPTLSVDGKEYVMEDLANNAKVKLAHL